MVIQKAVKRIMTATLIELEVFCVLLTYLLTYLFNYLLIYFNHVAFSVSLQPTAQVDARSVALQSCTKRFFSQDEYIRQRYACSLAVHCGLALGLQHGMLCSNSP